MVCNNWSTAVAQAWIALYCFCAVFSGGSCCLRDWLQFGDRCYQFVTDSPATFEVAQLSCEMKGGELTSISSADIRDYIAQQLNGVSDGRFWVGLRDKDAESPSFLFETRGRTPLKWLDGTSAEHQFWVLPSNSRLDRHFLSCYMYNEGIVKNEICTERIGYICSYTISNNSATYRQRPCNPSVPSWTEETFYGDATGKCVFRLPDLTTKENAEGKCFEYWGDILDLDGILMDSMSVLHEAANGSSKGRRMTNDGFRYWTDLRWNGTNILWSSGNTYGAELHLPIIRGTGSCITVEFNFTETLETHLYQTECNSTAHVFCSGSPVTMTDRRTTTERSLNDPSSSLSCPEGYNWKADGNYCYWETSFETERLSWFDAEKYCQSFGGHLTSFHNKEEEKIGLSFQYGSLAHPYWIGLQLDTETETYKWTDGTPLDYNNWAPGHPDHRDKRLRCVSFEAKETYWTSSLCGIHSWFICKVPKQVNPILPVLPTPTPLKSCDSLVGNGTLKSFYFDGACYFLISATKSWHRAKQFCENEGATLVSIHSDEEIGFLLKLLYENSADSARIWIGLNVLNSDGSLQWTDWSPVDLTYFNDVGSSTIQNQEKCCNMHNANGIWSYENCNADLSFICKRRNNTSSTTVPSTPDPRIGNCKKGWVAHHDRCYYVRGQREKDRVNWTQALQICHEHGGYLTSIRDENEQAFLAYLLQSLRFDAWIGLHDTIQSGRYYWLDNSDLQYTKWAQGEPSFFGMKEDCVKIVYNDLNSGIWKDDDCGKAYGYICQTRKDPTLPEPDYNRGINCLQPEGWIKLDNMCFKMFGGNTLSWSDAESSCRRESGHLVSISDKSIKTVVSYLGSEVNESFWIGLKYQESSQKLNWINGWPLALSNWEKNEPGLMKPDTCFSSTSEGYWKKAPCDSELPYVCQISTGKPAKPKMYTGNCPESSKLWTPGSGSYCYILNTDRRLDWFAANSICSRYGAHLTSIHSLSEIEDLKSLMKPGIKSVHIGLRKNSKGGFTWIDETPMDFVNWDEEPDSSSDDSCVEMMADTMGWRVIPCAAKKYVICQANKDTEFYENPESAKRTDDSSVSLSSAGLTAVIVSIIIVIIVIVAAALYYTKTASAKNRFQNPFRPQSSVSFENALYNVNSASMEFHDDPKNSLR